MKIATWNVNGIRARIDEVQKLVETERPDVVCLQEIKAASDQVPAMFLEQAGYWTYWHGERGYSGVALLVRRDFAPSAPVFAHPDFDHEQRIVTAAIGGITFASVYVPNGGKDFPAKLRFFTALSAWAQGQLAGGASLLIAGDLNIARAEIDVHPKERRKTTGQLPEERALFEAALAHGLTDLGRAAEPANEQLYTWWAPWRSMRERNIGWRLDYLLASADLAARLESCVVRREFGSSDHGVVLAQLR
ncbi:MAG: exodeoxyribonuclease III [Verrucomicrobia bacterium]|nr:exodeoxyribonuclease III [Verrucomicrobiota bacterium]